MPHITLVRHGQANSSAKDEASYDRLSDLGFQQAGWLGDHMRDTDDKFQRVYSGTLRRQVETARAMMGEETELVQDARLNEFSYFTMAQLLNAQQNVPMPDGREDFVVHLPLVFSEWMQGRIKDVPETYEAFEARVRDVIDEISAGQGRAVVITSGGVISLVMRQVLGLDAKSWSRVALAVQNTSVHRLHMIGDTPIVAQFNTIAHLEAPNRHFAQTYL